MPNWANTQMHIIGPKDQLDKLYKDIKQALDRQTAPSLESDWEENWLGNLYLQAGLTEKDWDRMDLHPRGYVNDYNYEDEPEPNIYLDYDCAWDGRIADFAVLLKLKYPKLRQVSCVEEPGMGVYYTNDEEYRFFSPYQVSVDMCYNEDCLHEYFDNPSEAVKSINEMYNTHFKTLEEMERKLNDSKSKKHQDDYCCINRIEIDHNIDAIAEAKIKQGKKNLKKGK